LTEPETSALALETASKTEASAEDILPINDQAVEDPPSKEDEFVFLSQDDAPIELAEKYSAPEVISPQINLMYRPLK